MPLSFTDDQIKNITQSIILMPFTIDDPVNGTGFVQQKESLVDLKGDFFNDDQDQKTIYDFWKSNISRYFQEYDLLNAQLGTEYSDTVLDNGGKELAPHFPGDPVWVPLIPKVLPANSGNPFNNTATITEEVRRGSVTFNINTLVTGFNYGSFDGAVENWVDGYFEISSANDVDVNDLGILSSNGNTTIIRILTKTPYQPSTTDTSTGTTTPEEPSEITYEFVGGFTGAHSATPNLDLSAEPISNSKRGRQTSLTSEEQALLDVYESNLNDSVDEWENHLDSQQAITSAYDDLAPRKQANIDANQNITDIKAEIQAWRDLTVVDPNGRYTDSGLGQLETTLNDRSMFSDQRALDLKNVQLGSVTQDPSSGEFSGGGIFFELMNTINLRIGKGTGTLNSFYGVGLGISLVDKKINDANTKLAQYENIFAVTRILSDTEVGDNQFDVEDVSQFANGQSVLVLDNESMIYRETITDITGDTITISNGIPVALTLGNIARIAREK